MISGRAVAMAAALGGGGSGSAAAVAAAAAAAAAGAAAPSSSSLLLAFARSLSSSSSGGGGSSMAVWPAQQQHYHRWQQQCRRGYAGKAAPAGAKAAGGGGGDAAAATAAVADDGAALERPTFRAAKPDRRDPLKALPESQRALLASMASPVADFKLRSARQAGWDLGAKDVMALLHDSMRDAAGGTPVLFTPFVVTDLLQSANSVAEWVKQMIESGEEFRAIERYFVQLLASEPRPNVAGLRIQIKGRLGTKSGKASKKVWSTGSTSVSTFDDPVDYAKAAAETSCGVIGIKVWVVYRRKAMANGGYFDRRLKAPLTVEQLLAMSRSGAGGAGGSGGLRASSAAWWALPGPLQPRCVGAAEPYRRLRAEREGEGSAAAVAALTDGGAALDSSGSSSGSSEKGSSSSTGKASKARASGEGA